MNQNKQSSYNQKLEDKKRRRRRRRRQVGLSGLETGGYNPDEYPISRMNDIARKYENIPADFGAEGFHGDIANKYGFGAKEIRDAQKHLIDLGYNVGKTGADAKWGPATHKAYEEYLGAYKYGYTDSQIRKQNSFNEEVRAYMNKRTEKYSKSKKKTEDTLIDSMKSIKY